MKKSKAIVFPSIPTLPIVASDYTTDKTTVVSYAEAKSMILGAVLRNDVFVPTEIEEMGPLTLTIVSWMDGKEFEAEKSKYQIRIEPRTT